MNHTHTHTMNLVLSSDAKPRLKWSQELHHRFVDAVNQLGGPEKATPKSLMRVMAISGLTLYHLKSHLQKYRLGRSQQSETCNQSQPEEEKKIKEKSEISTGACEENDESSQVARALRMQMDVQKKLQEQIEVQRHLQLRIEAQGKYLQSVLKKAQDTLSDYSCHEVKQVKVLGHSVESSLTSSDSSDGNCKRKANPVVLSLMEMRPAKSDDYSTELDSRKRRKNGEKSKDFDLNSKCVIDLNC